MIDLCRFLLKRVFLNIFLLVIILTSVLTFLLTTTSGLYTSIQLANLFLPGHIHVQKVTGRLLDYFSFAELNYRNKHLSIHIDHGAIQWNLKRLLRHPLTISHAAADTVFIQINDPSHIHIPSFTLPKKFQIKHLSIQQIKIQRLGRSQSFHHIALQAERNEQHWLLHSLTTDVANQHITLEANGQTIAPYALSSTLQISPLTKLHPGLNGYMKLDGDWKLYRWQGQVDGTAHGTIHGTLQGVDHKAIELSSQLQIPEGAMNAHVVYDAPSESYQGEVNGKNLHLHRYALEEAEFKLLFSGNTLQTATGKLEFTAQYLNHLLRINSNYDQTKINAQATLGANVVNVKGQLPYSWQAKISMPQPYLLHKSVSGLQTTILANATFHSAQDAILHLSINPGSYEPPHPSRVPAIKFKGGELTATLSPTSLAANGLLTIDPSKTINLALKMPDFHTIDGQLSLNIDSLDFLQVLSKDIEDIRGKLKLNLTAKGPLANPIVKGSMLLSNAGLSIPKIGLVLSPIEASLQSSNHHWVTQGSASSGDHQLTLKGQGDFSPQITGQLHIDGNNFPAVKNADYTINISPQLTIHFDPNALSVTGNIVVPSAQLKPLSFSNTVSLSNDAVFVHQSETPANPFNITTDVQITAGPNVLLDVKGLRSFLDGKIYMRQSANSALGTFGELTMRKGTYRAYGQDLVIDQGQLTYHGGALDNPELYIRAIRTFNNDNLDTASSGQTIDFSAANIDTLDVSGQTIVGIEMIGSLSSHKIKLFSIPPTLSQADILSMLLLGKPASQASQAGGQLLLAAISSMNLDSGTKGLQLLSQLKQSLGIDINVQNHPSYNQTATQGLDNTTFVIGKSISKRIYLSYNIGLLQQDNNVLTLRYLINKFFSIQVTNSDSGSGLDLLYTHSAR